MLVDPRAVAWNAIPNLRRRVNRARNFPTNTCPASRHLHLMAEAIAAGREYPMEQNCAGSMLSTSDEDRLMRST